MTAPGLPPTPTPNTQGLSGTTWVSGGGRTITSGLDPVDYAEYTQWMTIEYTRNPKYTNIKNTEFRSLTHLSATASGSIQGTALHFKITAYNSCRILHNNFTLSSYTQPQKIAIQANKFGKAGYSYGEVSGPNNLYVFGPQGSIITTQPYIRRDPKKATDVPYTFMQVGTGHAKSLHAYPFDQGCPNPNCWGDGGNIYAPYMDYLGVLDDVPTFPIFNDSELLSAWSLGGDYFDLFGGGYNTSSEPGFGNNSAGANRMIQFITTNCDNLNNPNVYQYRFIVPIPTQSNGFMWPQEADRLAVNPYYNSAHHDYS